MTSGVIYPLLNLISALVTILGIMGVLLSVDAFITLTSFSALVAYIFIGYVLSTRGLLNKNSQLIAHKSDLMIKSLQEGLRGYSRCVNK